MLSDKEKQAIDMEIAKFPRRQNACLDALLAVQKERGYISDETLSLVAEYLDMSATELDGIASFYNLIYRKPVGLFVIRLCDSVSCYILGYEEVKQTIKEEIGIDFGQTTDDKKFTLLPAQCLGACDKACAMMINDELYTNLKKESVKAIIKSHITKGANHGAAAHRPHEGQLTSSQSERI